MFLQFDVGAGQNFAEEHVNDLFSEIDPQNFVKCRLATVTATDNSVPQPSEKGAREQFLANNVNEYYKVQFCVPACVLIPLKLLEVQASNLARLITTPW